MPRAGVPVLLRKESVKPVSSRQSVVHVSRLVRDCGRGPAAFFPAGLAEPLRRRAFQCAPDAASILLVIDEPAPAWLVAVLAHAFRPRPVRLAWPGLIPRRALLACPPPSGFGGGPLGWRVFFGPPGALVCPDRPRFVSLSLLVPPDVGAGRAVFLPGLAPLWLAVGLAEAYAHHVPAVYLADAFGLWTCAITHSLEHSLGEQRVWHCSNDEPEKG